MDRNTRQRQAIRQVFEDADRPLGPQEVLRASQTYAPGIGIATVLLPAASVASKMSGWEMWFVIGSGFLVAAGAKILADIYFDSKPALDNDVVVQIYSIARKAGVDELP